MGAGMAQVSAAIGTGQDVNPMLIDERVMAGKHAFEAIEVLAQRFLAAGVVGVAGLLGLQ